MNVIIFSAELNSGFIITDNIFVAILGRVARKPGGKRNEMLSLLFQHHESKRLWERREGWGGGREGGEGAKKE